MTVRSIGRAALAALLFFASSCGTTPPPSAAAPPPLPTANADALLDRIEHDTFRWFWDNANPQNGLVPDRWPTKSFSSIAAVGFGLTAYGIGAERGWVTRDAAADRVLTTLRFFRDAKSGDAPQGMTSYKGFYYHFLDMDTGARFKDVELSTIDTTLMLAGALFCEQYFDRDTPKEREIRALAETLYRNAEWTFFHERPPLISMGWTPEHGLHDWDYTGYNEAMLLYILALGSPTHPVDPAGWTAYQKTYRWAEFYGQSHVNFPPLFGHQYSHVWIDFRGIQDAYMREKGIDYFENSRRATYAQRAYATANPAGFRGYGGNLWGLTACDGPLDGSVTIDGRERQFKTYTARGAAAGEINDDGTIAPTAAVSSVAFAPEIAIPAIEEMNRRLGAHVYRRYGYIDAFNETLNVDMKTPQGAVVPGIGWFDDDYLGIDQGPIITMIENHRSGLVWRMMRKSPHIVRGLQRAGFTGGWLEGH
ncbi:MAG: Tat pathway signal protein [Acidobacteria bacterium]|nr:Tat pathway signal protein [Acidobacteriota bacterium]MBV9478249.1 Tat pathway signal protein [Acidobacteriota bacterium]